MSPGEQDLGRTDERLVQEIFKFDERISFCGVVDSAARLVAGGMRPGVKSLEPTDETSKIVLRTMLGSSAIAASDKYLGVARFGVVSRDRVLQIVFALPNNRELQVAADPAFPLEKVSQIKAIVKSVTHPS